MSERIDRRVAVLVETAEPPADPAPGWERRATAAMGAGRPVRGRVRLLAVAVGVAAALVGLGFVPFPARGAKGALGRALAAPQHATTLHIIMHAAYNGRTYRYEEWWSSDGFDRTDIDIEDGWRTHTDIMTKGRRLSHWTYAGAGPDHYGAGRWGSDEDDPAAPPSPYHYPADREG